MDYIEIEMFYDVNRRGEEEIGIDVEPNWNGDPNLSMVTLAVTNVMVMAAIRRIAQYLASKKVAIEKVCLFKSLFRVILFPISI